MPSFGLGWAKSHSFHTGQTAVLKYSRRLMQAILRGRLPIGEVVNIKVISLDSALGGYRNSTLGTEQIVIDPHGVVPRTQYPFLRHARKKRAPRGCPGMNRGQPRLSQWPWTPLPRVGGAMDFTSTYTNLPSFSRRQPKYWNADHAIGNWVRMNSGRKVNMSLQTLYFIGALAIPAIPLTAGAQSLPANDQWTRGQWTTSAQADDQTAQRCPPGYDWEPAGYLGGGHWHPAFCGSRSKTINF